jgi:hypothetical protein
MENEHNEMDTNKPEMEGNKNKKYALTVLGIIALVISGIMFQVGSTSSHLDELLEYFWLPIPLGILLLAWAKKIK